MDCLLGLFHSKLVPFPGESPSWNIMKDPFAFFFHDHNNLFLRCVTELQFLLAIGCHTQLFSGLFPKPMPKGMFQLVTSPGID